MESELEKKQTQEFNDQFRTLSAYLQAAREEERKTIAREIHDELGQALTTMNLELTLLLEEVLHDVTAATERVHSLQRQIDSTIQIVKRLITKLRPGLLDDLGLLAAIDWQANEFQRLTGIICEVVSEPEDLTVDSEISTAIFRIFQEILTNVTRHSRATRVHVRLRQTENVLVLSVRDNGRGISTEEIHNPKSFGLIGMRERAQYWHGTVDISGETGKGTEIEVRFPIAPEPLS